MEEKLSRLDELKQEVSELEARTKAQPQGQESPSEADDPDLNMVGRDDPSWMAIADDDPELAPYLKVPEPTEDLDEIGRLVRHCWPHLNRPKTLTEAKRIVALRRRHRAIYAVIVDESKPRSERLAAIQTVLDTMLQPGSHPLRRFTTHQLLERVCPADTIRLFTERKELVRRPPEELFDVWVL